LDPVVAAPLTDAGLTSYRAVKKVLPALVPGSTVVVIGAGGLGQFAIQYLRLLTASRIVAIDTDETKHTTATSHGADLVIDPAASKSDVEVRAMTRGEGATVILDFVGSDSTLALALSMVARQGTVVIVGLEGGGARLTHGTAGEATVTASVWGTRSELEEVVALAAAGAISVTVDQFALADINTAAERLRGGTIPGRAVIVPELR
jgi:propanol-preferring alcohol dehydrogenase